MKCKNCGRKIGMSEDWYVLVTEMKKEGNDGNSTKEGEWEQVYCDDCGPPELRHLKSVNR